MKWLLVILVLFVSLPFSGCLILAGAEAGYIAGQDEKTAGETVSDQMITTQVKTKFLADSDIAGLRINVDTDQGVVTLQGRVASQKEMTKAVALAKSVKGVRRVISKLTAR